MRLSLPYVLRGFLLTLCCAALLFTVPPLQAQGTPNPNTAVQSIAETAQSLGALGFAVVCLGIALVVLIIGVLLFFWKAISPLLSAIIASNKARDEAAAAEREARDEQQSASSTQLKITDDRERETQALRTRQAEAMEAHGESLKAVGGSMETQARTMERIMDKINQNDADSEKGRKDAVDAINAHTDEKIDALRKDIEPMDAKLDKIITRLTPEEKPPLPPAPDDAPKP